MENIFANLYLLQKKKTSVKDFNVQKQPEYKMLESRYNSLEKQFIDIKQQYAGLEIEYKRLKGWYNQLCEDIKLFLNTTTNQKFLAIEDKFTKFVDIGLKRKILFNLQRDERNIVVNDTIHYFRSFFLDTVDVQKLLFEMEQFTDKNKYSKDDFINVMLVYIIIFLNNKY